MRSTANGISVSWREVGRGRPVVLVHGLADDHRAWRKVLPDLVLDHHVFLYDLRGHGETELGEPDGTLAQLATDLVGLMDAVHLDQAIIAGFSLGGTVAMRVGIDQPERVAGLALVATSSRVNAAAAQWYQERAEAVASGEAGLRQRLDQDTADVYRNEPGELEEGLVIRRQSTADPRGFANACRAMAGLHEHPLDDELGRIVAPTVVMSGEADQHCPPRAGEIIANGLKNASLRVIGATGHPIPVERPREVAEAIRSLDA
ncbi:MAG: alpha/beta hydrolase [Acidimicrobiales bacterium]